MKLNVHIPSFNVYTKKKKKFKRITIPQITKLEIWHATFICIKIPMQGPGGMASRLKSLL